MTKHWLGRTVLGVVAVLVGVVAGGAQTQAPKAPASSPDTLGATTSSPSPTRSPSPSVRATRTPRKAPAPTPAPKADLTDPRLKELALQLVGTAENSSLRWWDQYGYIEDIGDVRGYTGGLVGFCSGTGDMLLVIERYVKDKPSGNVLAAYLPELRRLASVFASNGFMPNSASAETAGLGSAFVTHWKQAASDPLFQLAQRREVDRVYFNPALKLAKADGLGALGQFAYYDAAVNMGSVEYSAFKNVRAKALKTAKLPSKGGSQAAYLKAFLQARTEAMGGGAYGPTRRVIVQQQFLGAGKLGLEMPLKFTMYQGDNFNITVLPKPH